ncbi:fatty-acid amide hydrolase [Colletotrichum plurivorum]|uniref:amidase n=1 Tax=Colletotrichum plurivorum TaxID=2175906 RepID=A0A8H6NJP5_9PEZI|nr:fatty-acid amide hydrolase [Colletotrichum plurivorum]
MPPTSQAPWETKAEACRKILKDSLNPKWLLPEDQLPPQSQLNVANFIETCGLLTPRELEITSSTATELTNQMAEGRLTAVETVTAFLKRSHVAHQLVNFATEFMVKDALAAAAELDKHFQATGKLVGPLHGVPISAKEHLGFKGRISHSGYVAWTDNVVEEDALVIRLAKAAGAVFHVRTNEPQSVMHLDCDNPIYGATVNPYNRNLTSGGSSGGEGASLGLRCAVLGIGTDIGGSVRVPAAFCGSYGLRTTAMRNPYKGVCIPGLGQESIRCILGPLANSVSDINLFQKTVLDQEPWEEETSLVSLPWKSIQPYQPGTFTVGVIWDDGIVHPHSPVTRALKHAVEKLKAAGIKVVDFEPYNHKEGAEVINTLYFPDAAATLREILKEGGEPVADLTEWAFAYSKPEPLSIRENWELNVRRDAFRDAYHRAMRERGVDFILCPAYVGVAARLGEAQYWHYTTIWNILDQPSITFPTGLYVDPAIDVVEKDYTPRSDEDEREYKKCRKRKVKCGEERPTCRNCIGCSRECVWPSSDDLQDRRFRARRSSSSSQSASGSPSPPSSPSPSSVSACAVSSQSSIIRIKNREIPDIEHELMHHYLNVLITALLLPTVTEVDLEEYGSQVVGMMMGSDSVKYAVLANCASNKYMLSRNIRYQKAALVYYLKAIELVNHALPELGYSKKSPGDALLTTVVYLYLYNFWGSDTSVDARKHIDGAMSLLKLRYADTNSPLSMTRPLHRVTTESVLYQAFLLAIRQPFAPNFHVDKQFLTRSEDVLHVRSFLDSIFNESSLVLGLPLRLYRLITDIIDIINPNEPPKQDVLIRIREEMKTWENSISNSNETEFIVPARDGFEADAVALFVLGASLLLDYVSESSPSTSSSNTTTSMRGTRTFSLRVSSSRWQIKKALSILRRPAAYETWTRCYLGAWPLLILGYSVTDEEDISLLRRVSSCMRDRIGYGEVQRIQADLEAVWVMQQGYTAGSLERSTELE